MRPYKQISQEYLKSNTKQQFLKTVDGFACHLAIEFGNEAETVYNNLLSFFGTVAGKAFFEQLTFPKGDIIIHHSNIAPLTTYLLQYDTGYKPVNMEAFKQSSGLMDAIGAMERAAPQQTPLNAATQVQSPSTTEPEANCNQKLLQGFAFTLCAGIAVAGLVYLATVAPAVAIGLGVAGGVGVAFFGLLKACETLGVFNVLDVKDQAQTVQPRIDG